MRKFKTSTKSSRRLMNPTWSESDADCSIFLPTKQDWKPSVAKKLFVPRRGDVSVAIMSFPNGTNEAIVLRGNSKFCGDGLHSGTWTPIHMRLELQDVDTVPELHLDISEHECITLPLNYLSDPDVIAKEIVTRTMHDRSTSDLSKVQPLCLSNAPQFSPTDLLACFTVQSFDCDKVGHSEAEVEDITVTSPVAAASSGVETESVDQASRTQCSLVLRTRTPEEKLAWISAIQRSIAFSFTPFTEYMSRFGGLVAGASQHSDGKYFSTFHFHLKFVKRVFGDNYQHKNTNHPHFDKLFGEGVQGKMVRSVIRSTHSALYRPGVNNCRVRRGYIDSARTFLECVTHIDIDEEKRFGGQFTYVLLDSGLRISETDANFTKDMLSKHAMHCNMAEKVRYAGECHFQWAQEGADQPKFWLVLDNNSGTYAPSPEQFPLLKRVFKLNFPDLEIETITHDDPRMKLYKTRSSKLVSSAKDRRTSLVAAHSMVIPMSQIEEEEGGKESRARSQTM